MSFCILNFPDFIWIVRSGLLNFSQRNDSGVVVKNWLRTLGKDYLYAWIGVDLAESFNLRRLSLRSMSALRVWCEARS